MDIVLPGDPSIVIPDPQDGDTLIFDGDIATWVAAAPSIGHVHLNLDELDLISEGDHSGRKDNPHETDVADGPIGSSNNTITDIIRITMDEYLAIEPFPPITTLYIIYN